MKWEVYVARVVQMRNSCKILVGKPERRDRLEDLGI